MHSVQYINEIQLIIVKAAKIIYFSSNLLVPVKKKLNVYPLNVSKPCYCVNITFCYKSTIHMCSEMQCLVPDPYSKITLSAKQSIM